MEFGYKNKRSLLIGLLLITLVMVGLGYFYTYNPTKGEGVFLRCPSNLIFGIYCPGCGTQRALYHLLHLELKEALRYNVLFVLSLAILLYALIIKGINLIFGTKKTIPFFTHKYVIIGLLVMIILFGIVRNLPYYPFNLLVP